MIMPLLAHAMIWSVGKAHNIPDQICEDIRDSHAASYIDPCDETPDTQIVLEVIDLAHDIAIKSCRSGRTLNVNRLTAELLLQYAALTKTWSNEPKSQASKKARAA